MTTKLALAGALNVLLGSALLYLAFRHIDSFRVELGALDEGYRNGDAAWSRGYVDSGPYRLRRGEKTMTYFVARAALVDASVSLPARVSHGGLALRLRAHRYGQPGVVQVLANGAHVGRLVFERDSYPWDVWRLRIPEPLAARVPIEIHFLGEEVEPRVDLPPGTSVALDWVEVAPLDPNAYFVPTGSQWLVAVLVPFLILISLSASGASFAVVNLVGGLTAATVALGHMSAPAQAAATLEHLWIVFPMGGLVYVVSRFALDHSELMARRLGTAFALLLLVHSVILFFPNHHPPDLKAHLGQVARLETFTRDQFWEFSSTTPEPGRLKPHTGFSIPYVAPYPPWVYFIVHGATRVFGGPRFWFEFLGMTCAAGVTLLTYALARVLAKDARAAPYAFCLMTLEVSTWHHAARGHTPSVFGQIFFLAAATYLAYAWNNMTRRRLLWLVGFSFAASLSYPGALIHWALFLGLLVLVDGFTRKRWRPSAALVKTVVAAAGGGLLSLAAFYRHFVKGALSDPSVVTGGEAFRTQATFFFLRNQMRDSARILELGYPFWVFLALPALARLRAWTKDGEARTIVLAWTVSYALHLLLKDPLFLPQLFLNVKEDLMFAPLASVAGGMTLAALSRRGRKGRVLAAAALALALFFQVRDFLYNADTVLSSLSDAS